MYYEITTKLLEGIAPYIASEHTVTKSNKDWKGHPRASDCVTVDEKHNVGFAVFDEEIIVFYFTEHRRFSDVYKDKERCIKQAKDFLIELLTLPLCHVETYKGKKRVSEKYVIMYFDKGEEIDSGGMRHKFMQRLRSFGRKAVKTTIWQYDKPKGIFTIKPPQKPCSDAIEVISVNDACYIEVFEKNGVFSFCIQKLEYDDYYDTYFWMPMEDRTLSLFDTKAKAIQAAKEKLR